MIAFLIILSIVIVTTYLVDRNNKVYAFSLYISDLAYLYNLRRIEEYPKKYEDAHIWFADKWTYEQMLFSLKPLRLDNWFTEEELEEIKR